MRIIYDPKVDALTIRLIEGKEECEVIQLNDQVAVDIGKGERMKVAHKIVRTGVRIDVRDYIAA